MSKLGGGAGRIWTGREWVERVFDVPPGGLSGALSGGRFSRVGVDGDGEERRDRMVWMSLMARYVNVTRKRAA